MTWPFENDTSAITKKIAKNDIDKNRVKKIFSLTTIVFATALLMMLIMFESGYETTKDRMAEGQPQVVFYDLSQQQIELLYSDVLLFWDELFYYESFGLFAVLIQVQLAATGVAAFRIYYKQGKG